MKILFLLLALSVNNLMATGSILYDPIKDAYAKGVSDGELEARLDISMAAIHGFTFVRMESAPPEELYPTYWKDCLLTNKKLNDERVTLPLRIYACMIWQKLNRRILFYQGFRTVEEQQKAFKAGNSKLDGVTKKSEHQRGLATDWVLRNKDMSLNWGSDSQSKRDYGYYGGYIEGYFSFFRFIYSGYMDVDNLVLRQGITGWKCGHTTKNAWDFGHLEMRHRDDVQSECSEHFLTNDYL